ncbi:hypothetical protein Tsp_09707 [Trichinella spiralis]|uniref:hypothetical protein n=1 Tax=Trichinella spiralis TaxID=6334 RepID=UPI0001EFD50B|nr:hypothetical protein Tsp_09707 [Trichinella spiralis]
MRLVFTSLATLKLWCCQAAYHHSSHKCISFPRLPYFAPIFPKTLPTLSYANSCVPHRKGCHYVAFFCLACLSVFYINPTLTLKTSFPPSPPRTSISAANSEMLLLAAFFDFLILTQSTHKNLNALEIARSVVLTNVEDAAR